MKVDSIQDDPVIQRIKEEEVVYASISQKVYDFKTVSIQSKAEIEISIPHMSLYSQLSDPAKSFSFN